MQPSPVETRAASESFCDFADEGGECYELSGSVGSSQETSVVLGGAVGVSEVFGIRGRERVCLVTAFFALRCFSATRVGRFASAFARAVLWTRFARLVLVVRRFAMRPS